MKREYRFFVYIMASKSGTLYVGFTNNVFERVFQHKTGHNDGFTNWYGCHRLVYYEEHQYVLNAIEREKQIKCWRRAKKEALIRTMNPKWHDLAERWHEGR